MEPNPQQVVAVIACLLPIGLAVRASLRLLYGARGPASWDGVHHLVNVTGWSFIATGLVAFAMMTFWFSFILLIILAQATLELVNARRNHSRQAAWAVVGSAAKQGRSLHEAAEVASESFQGSAFRIFARFVNDLKSGISPVAAIAKNRRAFPRSAMGQAALAKTGQMTLLAGDVSEDADAGNAWARVTQRLAYFAWLGLVAFVILTGIFIYIVPSFEQIFLDFDLELPAMTQSLIQISSVFIGSNLSALVSLGVSITLLALFVLWILYLCDLHPLAPIADRVFFSHHRARVLRLLALAVENGMTFEAALSNLSLGSPRYASPMIARRLQRVLYAAEFGMSWHEAFQKQGFMHASELPLFTAAAKAGNLPWAFRTVADRIVARSVFRWEIFQQIAFPIATLAIGSIIGWIVIALFIPLVSLITNLT